MKTLRTSLAVMLAWLLVSTTYAQAPSVEQLVDTYFEELLQLDPLLATYIGDYRYNDRLPNDIAPEAVAQRLAFEQRYLDAAMRIDVSTLSAADRLTWDIFVRQRREHLAGAKFPEHLLPVNQLFSLPLILPLLASGEGVQPFANARDYESFHKRLEAYVAWSDQAIANLREGVRRDIVQPRAIMERVLAQIDEIAAVDDPQESLFFAAVRRMPSNVGPEDAKRIAREYEATIGEKVLPAYRRLRDFIRDEYLPKARTSVAWTALPDGAAWYAYRVKVETTTELSPDEIHELGLREVARIRSEMERIRRHVKFKGDLKAFFHHLQMDPKFYFERPEDLLRAYKDLKRKIDARLPKLFRDFPKAGYEVRPVEAFRAASAPGGSYQEPSADGSRPGIFYVNTFNLRAQPKFGMETLALHEAAPGHHFQIALQQEIEALPRFRRFGHYTAFAEGWALYAESLGPELGLFDTPYDYFGRLNDEMLRAMRLVVDTGLHTKNWSREQAIEYMLENSSLAPSDVQAEVERYIADPAQALAYKLGQLKFSELRERARRQLGRKFDIKEFHSVVLRDGSMPLDVLDARIQQWIDAQRGGSKANDERSGLAEGVFLYSRFFAFSS